MPETTNRSRNNARKTPKLRASCDSCSLAKVRCTQTKPACTRCLKHEVPCMYGISRRSGKRSAESYQAMKRNAELEIEKPSAASEIDMSFLDGPLRHQSPGQSTPTLSVKNIGLNQSSRITSNGLLTPPMGTSMDFQGSTTCLEFPNSPSIDSVYSSNHGRYTSSPDSCPDLSGYINRQLKDWAIDDMFNSNLLSTPQVSPKTTDDSSFFHFEKRENHHESTPLEYNFLASGHVEDGLQYFKPSSIYSQSPTSEADFVAFSSSQSNFSDAVIPSIETDSYFEHQPQPKGIQTNISGCAVTLSPKKSTDTARSLNSCQCNENIISHLSLPENNESNKSSDMSLAQLQETLKMGSNVLDCACTTTNRSIPVSLSLLAARIVSILERLCHKAREDDSRPPSQMASRGDQYSLGMYQIAKEDERRLKQEMLGLQIKKAELLVLCSREVVGRVKGPMDTQAMVSDKLFSFLSEKIGEVKKEWNAKNDEV